MTSFAAIDPGPVIDLIDGFRRSKAMFSAVSLGIFDILAERPASASELATRIGGDRGALERLLNACCALGLLKKRDEVYENEAVAAAYLRRDSPETLAGYIQYSDDVLFRLWSNLTDAVRHGTNRWSQTFGIDGPIFDHFFRTEGAMRTFVDGMHGFGLLSSTSVVAAFDLSGFRRLVDLGGATGHLAVAAHRRYPGLHAVVFDLPKIIGIARERTQLAGGGQSVEFVAGDFFVDPLPEADLYALGRILHDWGEEKIRSLLTRIYDRLPRGGGLLIAEKLLNDEKTGPAAATLQSLNMLVCTEGAERTLPEYTLLLQQAGFSTVKGKWTGSPLDAVLALKHR